MKFTHLHVHSHYSLLDGLPKIDELLDYAKELGMDSIALTDHGVMYGAIEFYKKAKAKGIKPIIGCEVYTAFEKLSDKRSKIDDKRNQLILLAKNEQGYKNLVKLVTIAHLEGFNGILQVHGYAGGLQRGGRLFEVFCLARTQHDFGAGFAKRLRQLQAQAT